MLHELAQIKAHAGQFAEAQQLAEEGLTLCRQLGRPDWKAHSLDTLGWITFCLGEYDHSKRYYQESMDLFQELNHQLFVVYNRCSLGAAACGRQEWRLGRTQLTAAVQSAVNAQLLPGLMIALFHYARLLMAESTHTLPSAEQRQQLHAEALRVLWTVVRHPACLAYYRDLGQKLIDQMAPELHQDVEPVGIAALLDELSISVHMPK